VESVYSAVRTESLYKTDTLRLYRVNMIHSNGMNCTKILGEKLITFIDVQKANGFRFVYVRNVEFQRT
jgi:hypothetical protein